MRVRPTHIAGVRFHRAGRVHYFSAQGLDLYPGDLVVVDTPEGPRLGWVAIAPSQLLYHEVQGSLRPVLRRATPEDLARLPS